MFSVSVWGMTRGRTPTQGQLVLISNALRDALGITMEELHTSDHSVDACYVLPVIAPGLPIILPGQCDPDITVQQQFSLTDVSIK